MITLILNIWISGGSPPAELITSDRSHAVTSKVSINKIFSSRVNLGQIRRNYEESMVIQNSSSSIQNNTSFNTDPFESQREWWWPIFTSDYTTLYYSVLYMLIIILTVSRSLAFYRWCLTAATKMHHAMFNNMVYSPMKFFNTNPSGRILNRFSKDIGALDESLPSILSDSIMVRNVEVYFIFCVSFLSLFSIMYCHRQTFINSHDYVLKSTASNNWLDHALMQHSSFHLQGVD